MGSSSSSWPVVFGVIAVALAAFWYDAHNAKTATAGVEPVGAAQSVAAQAMR